VEFARLEVPARLRGLVAAGHGYRVPPIAGGVHHGLPSRHLTLVLSLAAPLVVDGFGARLSAHAVVGGLHTTPALLDASLPQDGVQLALTPAGARALLGVPASELAGGVVDLQDVVGRRGAELVERLAAADDPGARLAVLDAWLEPMDVPPVPAEVARAWHVLLRSRGRVRVERLAAEVGWSRRHLGERFIAATGLPPKQLARIVRFENARRHLARPEVPLAEVAARCGYADQAHLAREWREMAGCTPGEWRRVELPFVQDGAPARAAG
jgi:AraC-like DNA-binding protein